MRRSRRMMFQVVLAVALVAGILVPGRAAAALPDASSKLKKSQKEVLRQYAADTWQSFVALADPGTGLPSDNVDVAGVRSQYTSPTNIATYLWSTLAARDLRIISRSEALERIGKTLATTAALERHTPSGQFYNWYDPATGAKLTTWPVDGGPVYPFLSSVDNGWLAAALIMVANGVPQLRDQAQALAQSMDFGCYYDPAAGLIRGGFWDTTPQPGSWPVGNYCGKGGNVFYTGHHYGTLNTEPRIASYIGIAWGQIPATHYFKMWRTFPSTCDWGWPEMQPQGVTRTYLGVDVFEGHYTYRDMQIVPSWGGSMFEALMVPLLVPEEEWGRKSWGVNHPLYVRAQIEHGIEEADYGYWGFSPANKPEGGYSEYGVDAIGMNPDGYASNNDKTLVDYGFGECPGREPKPEPPASAYTNGVVTPHASFLALEFAPDDALENLAELREDFEVYGAGGFYDSVNIDTGVVSQHYLALDQGMIMAAIANALTNDRLQRYFTKGAIKESIKPLLKIEEFTAGD
ncbi:MAG: DUF3131 domain-containing protein [Chloroflexales bacterium]|nr:DUF3131 domain-containing protein [Chloroflexales bacterium]